MQNLLNNIAIKLREWGVHKWDTLLLRVGLALTLFYAGISIFYAPTNWVGFVPAWIDAFYPAESFILIHAALDVLLAVGLLSGRFVWFFSGVTFFNITSILLFYGVDDVTFRDIGLVFAALALFVRSISSLATNKAASDMRPGSEPTA